MAPRQEAKLRWQKATFTGLREQSARGEMMQRPLTAMELAIRRSAIPEDRRNLTAQLMGDPLPGRSANG